MGDDAALKAANGVAFTGSGDAAPYTWDYADESEKRFWSEADGEALKFYAVSPMTEKTGSDKLTTGSLVKSIAADAQTLTYTVPTACEEQVDLMFAASQEYASDDETAEHVKNGITLQFRHALSQIVFKAKTDSELVFADVESVKVKNLHGAGVFDIAKGEAYATATDKTAAAFPWTYTVENYTEATSEFASLVPETTNINTSYGDNGDEEGTATAANAYAYTDGTLTGSPEALLLLPQTPKANDAVLVISCRVRDQRGENDVVNIFPTDNSDTYTTIEVPLTTEQWQPGYKYVYTLVFTADMGNPVKVQTVEVDEWNDATEDVTVEDPREGTTAVYDAQSNAFHIYNAAQLADAREKINSGATYTVDADGNVTTVAASKTAAISKTDGDDDLTIDGGAPEIMPTSFSYAAANYILMDNIDLSAYESWEAIGNESNAFEGEFDGNGKVISNLTLKGFATTASPTFQTGLFGQVKGLVKNVTIANLSATGNYVGGVVCSLGSGTIEHCTVSGTFTGTNYGGGIAYWNGNGNILNCTSNVTATGVYRFGGIVDVNTGIITGCVNNGNISGTSSVGGIAASSSGVIAGCYNTAALSGTTTGGIVAEAGTNSTPQVIASYNTGAVSGTTAAGGIAGSNTITVTHCYYTAADSQTGVAGTEDAAGATTAVTDGNWEDARLYMSNALHGLYSNGESPNALYDWKYEVNSGANSTTAPLTLAAGAVFTDIAYKLVLDAEATGNDEIPTLQISSADDLAGLRQNIAKGLKYSYNGNNYDYQVLNYIQTATIDLSTKCGENIDGQEVSWTPVFSTFKGTYDGGSDKGYEIQNLYINSNSAGASLFGPMNGEFSDPASIKNVNVTSADVTVSGSKGAGIVSEMRGKDKLENCSFKGRFDCSAITYGGAIANSVSGQFPVIRNCHFNGEFIGGDDAGCIVGYFYGQYGEMSGCTSSGTATWAENKNGGGIIGWASNSGAMLRYDMTVTDCHNACHITSGGNVGGIIGKAYDVTITACYNTGRIRGKNAAGIVHNIVNYNSALGQIIGCYNSGEVTGSEMAAGIAADLFTSGNGETVKIASCYNSGTIDSPSDDCKNGSLVSQYNPSSNYASKPNGTISNCCYSSSHDAVAVGSDRFTTTNTQSVSAWDDTTIGLLNTDLSSWEYITNTGDDASIRPLVLQKK